MLTPLKKVAQKYHVAPISSAYFLCLNAHSLGGLVGKTGGDGDAIVACGLQITPVIAGDGLD